MKFGAGNRVSAERLAGLVRLVLCVAFALAIAHSLALLTWRLVPVGGDAASSLLPQGLPDRTGNGLAAGGEGAEEAAASRYRLFGGDDIATGKGKAEEAGPLPLELKGILARTGDRRSLAVFALKEGAGRQIIAGEGEPLAGGFTVRAILPDQVVLVREGRDVVLTLKEKHGPLEKSGSGVVAHGDGMNFDVSRRYLDRSLADVAALSREIGVAFHSVGKRTVGYRLIGGQKSGLMHDLELRDGDVINEVNGVPLTDVENGLAVFKTLQDASEIRLVLTRNGSRRERLYHIKGN